MAALVGSIALLSSCNPAQPTATPPAQSDPSKVPSAARSIFDLYLKISDSLAGDSLDGLPERASAMAEDIRKLPNFPQSAAAQAESLGKADNLTAARKAFQPLSQTLIQYLKEQNAQGAYFVAYCPMAKASWLQTDSKIRNPYYGKAMLDCGEIQK